MPPSVAIKSGSIWSYLKKKQKLLDIEKAARQRKKCEIERLRSRELTKNFEKEKLIHWWLGTTEYNGQSDRGLEMERTNVFEKHTCKLYLPYSS